jgi:hypothetical protein
MTSEVAALQSWSKAYTVDGVFNQMCRTFVKDPQWDSLERSCKYPKLRWRVVGECIHK